MYTRIFLPCRFSPLNSSKMDRNTWGVMSSIQPISKSRDNWSKMQLAMETGPWTCAEKYGYKILIRFT